VLFYLDVVLVLLFLCLVGCFYSDFIFFSVFFGVHVYFWFFSTFLFSIFCTLVFFFFLFFCWLRFWLFGSLFSVGFGGLGYWLVVVFVCCLDFVLGFGWVISVIRVGYLVCLRWFFSWWYFVFGCLAWVCFCLLVIFFCFFFFLFGAYCVFFGFRDGGRCLWFLAFCLFCFF